MSSHQVCSYQQFDPVTLTPLSSETELRMRDLERFMPLVAGRSVLDIGCNGGMVSAVALRAGASRVLATDVNQDFVDATTVLLESHPGPSEVRRSSFRELGPEDRCQVTLLLEVYHWLIQQRLSPDFIADKLDELTAELLVIEAPWDRSDPSVAASLRDVEYELPPLLTLLEQRGFRIELLGFASYFPPEFQRAIFLARRTSTPQSQSFVSPTYRKKVRAESPLVAGQTLSPLVESMVELPMQILLAPLEVDREQCEIVYPMLDVLSPYIGTLRSSGYSSNVFDVAVTLAGDLLLLRASQSTAVEIPWDALALVSRGVLSTLECPECKEQLLLRSPTPSSLLAAGTYVHGDLHLSNVVHTTVGLRVIDPENLHTGPAYTDIVCYLLALSNFFRPDTVSRLLDDFWSACAYLAPRFGRSINLSDVAHGAQIVLQRVRASGLTFPLLARTVCELVAQLAPATPQRHDTLAQSPQTPTNPTP